MEINLRRNIAKFTNWALVVAGSCLLIFQLHGYFTSQSHHTKNIEIETEHKPHSHDDGEHSHTQ